MRGARSDKPNHDPPAAGGRSAAAAERKLLVRAAEELARRKGLVRAENPPDEAQSRLAGNSVALVDANQKLIVRIPLEAARQRLRQRARIARRLLRPPLARLPAVAWIGAEGFSTHQLRLLEDGPRAMAWAIGSGEPFPDPGSRLEHVLITFALLILCVVPGLCYAGYRLKERGRLKDELRQLVVRWRTMGRPDPPESFFLMVGR